jgi:hypothetical protein
MSRAVLNSSVMSLATLEWTKSEKNINTPMIDVNEPAFQFSFEICSVNLRFFSTCNTSLS